MKPDEIVVFILRTDTECAECGQDLPRHSFLRVEGERGLCLDCADLGHLEFLSSGDAAVTRRASKYSSLRAVVVEWARARKRYERQGILVEPAAIDRAESDSLADADLRAQLRERAAVRREVLDAEYVSSFPRAVRAQFPGCPAKEAEQIAEHACRKYSGRVGRSAAAKALDPVAVTLAVQAHARHAHTQYDRLLSRGHGRLQARHEVRDEVHAVLDHWRSGRGKARPATARKEG